jgi:hypothetical protein
MGLSTVKKIDSLEVIVLAAGKGFLCFFPQFLRNAKVGNIFFAIEPIPKVITRLLLNPPISGDCGFLPFFGHNFQIITTKYPLL